MVCERAQDSDESTVYFQVAELPEGLRVVHVEPRLCGTPVLLDADAGVDLTRTLLLKSSTTPSNFYDDDDSPVVFPRSGRELATVGMACGTFSAQLTEWTGATVVRGFFDGGSPLTTQTLTGLPPAGPNTALLVQTVTPDSVALVCSALLRGTLASPSTITFSRGGSGDGGCPAAPMPGAYFERIDFGPHATVQQHVVVSVLGEIATVQVRPYDLSRTLLFASSQTVAGQGAGETNAVDSFYPAGTAAFVPLTSTQVSALRADRSLGAVHTLYVVELNP